MGPTASAYLAPALGPATELAPEMGPAASAFLAPALGPAAELAPVGTPGAAPLLAPGGAPGLAPLPAPEVAPASAPEVAPGVAAGAASGAAPSPGPSPLTTGFPIRLAITGEESVACMVLHRKGMLQLLCPHAAYSQMPPVSCWLSQISHWPAQELLVQVTLCHAVTRASCCSCSRAGSALLLFASCMETLSCAAQCNQWSKDAHTQAALDCMSGKQC